MTSCSRPRPSPRCGSPTRTASTWNENGKPADTIPSVVAASAAPAGAPEATADATLAAATGSAPGIVAQGKQAFRVCQTWHEVGDGARNTTCPHLNDLSGRRAGSIDGFRFSRQVAAAGTEGLVWTPETLHDFLMKPRDRIQETRMAFPGYRDEADIAADAAYLQTCSD